MGPKTVKVVTNPDPTKLRFISSRDYYKRLAAKLGEGNEVFVSDMGRRQAHYARKRFEAILGRKVTSSQALYQDTEGYVFSISK